MLLKNLVCDVLHSESCSGFKEGDTGQDVDIFLMTKL